MVLWTMSSALNIVHEKTNGRSAKTWPSKSSLVGTAKEQQHSFSDESKIKLPKKRQEVYYRQKAKNKLS